MFEDQIFCSTCGENTVHLLIKTGQETLVRCEICGTVHSIQKERERLVTLRAIVNKDNLSMPHIIKLPAKDILRVGDDLLVDDASKDVVMTEITSLETDKRVNSACAQEVKTIWARSTDEVPLKISVYRNGLSHPIKTIVPGDEVFEVGEIRQVDGIRFNIVKIKLRNSGFADTAEAKSITRVWGREL